MLRIEHGKKNESPRALKEIVRLIYDTDPYIYPGMFDDYARFESAFLELLMDERSIFFVGRMYLAYEDNLPVGLLLPFKKGEGVVPKFGEHYADYVVGEVFKKSMGYLDGTENTVYINNVCVSAEMRGKKIGHTLMREFIAACGNEKIVLDCLRDNPVAVRLYLDCGFEIKKHTDGFAGKSGASVPVVWMERPATVG